MIFIPAYLPGFLTCHSRFVFSPQVHEILGDCGTHMEHIVFVLYLFRDFNDDS